MSLAIPVDLILSGFFADKVGTNYWFLISGIWNADWLGNMIDVKKKIEQLHDSWKDILVTLSEDEFLSCKKRLQQ